MKMLIAIQCPDKRTLKRGTFAFKEEHPFYSVTPVFSSLDKLIDYMKKNNIDEIKPIRG